MDHEIFDKKHEVTNRLRTSVRYHQRRVRFFDAWDLWAKALSVLAGTWAATILLQSSFDQGLLLWATFVITVLNTFSLVFGFSSKTRLHSDLVRQYLELEARVVSTINPTHEFLADIEGKIRFIEINEPPPLGTLVVICQNEIARQDGEYESIVPVGWFRLLLANYFDFQAPKSAAQISKSTV